MFYKPDSKEISIPKVLSCVFGVIVVSVVGLQYITNSQHPVESQKKESKIQNSQSGLEKPEFAIVQTSDKEFEFAKEIEGAKVVLQNKAQCSMAVLDSKYSARNYQLRYTLQPNTTFLVNYNKPGQSKFLKTNDKTFAYDPKEPDSLISCIPNSDFQKKLTKVEVPKELLSKPSFNINGINYLKVQENTILVNNPTKNPVYLEIANKNYYVNAGSSAEFVVTYESLAAGFKANYDPIGSILSAIKP